MPSPIVTFVQQLIDNVDMPVGIRPTVRFFHTYDLRGWSAGIEIKAPGVPDDISMIGICIPTSAKGMGRKKAIVKKQFSPQVVQGAVARILSPLKLSQDTRNWVRRHEKYYHTKYSPNTPA